MTYDLNINARALAIKPSATLAVSARANALRAAGKQVLNFSAGEPDFRPPVSVTRHVVERLEEERVAYAPVPGLPALRDAAARELSEYHGRSIGRDEILISCGAKHSLANLFMVTLSPGDEVVIPTPYWVSYPAMVELGSGTPVFVEAAAERGFKLDPERLAGALSDRTRFVVLNSPSNPTGVGYTAAEVRALGEVICAKAPQAWIVCDDIYRKLVFDGYEHVSAFRALEGLTDRVVIVDGVSKSYAMTGYRIGILAAPAPVVKAAAAVQGQTTSGAATPSQWAALEAMTNSAAQEDVVTMRGAFAERRQLMLDGLREVPGVTTVRPDGAFYVFPNFGAYVKGRFADDVALATWLLEEKLVASVPGSAFGAPGHLRLSFATSEDEISEGLRRIKAAIESLASGGAV